MIYRRIDRMYFLAETLAELIGESDSAFADRLWPYAGELRHHIRNLRMVVHQEAEEAEEVTRTWVDVFNRYHEDMK